jgi:cation diffusion facilitator CzcD-associated flavoprotein CzcO
MLVSKSSESDEDHVTIRTQALSLTARHIRLTDKNPPPRLANLSSLAKRTADPPLEVPAVLPARTPRSQQPRFTESSVYDDLHTNIDAIPMSYSQEPIPEERSAMSISRHGPETPFRHHSVIRDYIASLVNRNGYEKLVSYNTTVEKAEKVGNEWRLVLRKEENGEDVWWEERFDAIVVASGHFSVPYIPAIEGLEEMEKQYTGSVKHSKMFRGRDAYRGKV